MGTIHRTKVIERAKEWIGYEEGENNWTIFSKILDDCGYYAPQEKQGQPWCHNFINCMFLIAAEPSDRDDDEKKYDAQNYLCQPSRNNLSCGCTFGADYFRAADLFYPVTEAEIGDVVYFGKRGEESHVGLIVDLDRDENGDITRIYTIEGNKGDKVDSGSYSVNYSRISGIGHLRYDDYYDDLEEKTEEPAPAEPTPEPAPDPEPKPEEPTKQMTVCVNTRLNVRWGAGTDNPIKYQLQNGETVQIYEEQDGWARIGDDAWVCMDYLK
jgi:hypothetical protein